MKTCADCQETKALQDFAVNKSAKSGFGTLCKICKHKRNLAWRAANYEKFMETQRANQEKNRKKRREQSKAWREANPERRRQLNRISYEKNKERDRATALLWKVNNPEKYWVRNAVNGARKRAKEFGVAFNLTKEYLMTILPSHCPVLGLELAYVNDAKAPLRNSPSLDRIIPHLGYVQGNVAVISMRANWIKSDASLVELNAITNWLKSLVKLHGEDAV